MVATLSEEIKHYLVTIRPDNLQRLRALRMGFFALSAAKVSIRPGDRIVLYKTRGETGDAPGIVGTFEVIEEPYIDRKRDFVRVFSIRIPWKARINSLEQPMPVAPLVLQLEFFPNKQNYGASLQGTLKRLSLRDYMIVEDALIRHCDDQFAGRAEAHASKQD